MRQRATSLAAVTLVALFAVCVLGRPGALSPAAGQAGDEPSVTYHPPVDAPVTDPFRPPPEPWAPGNRGIEYATAPGTPVLAAAEGEVVFAGPVAGDLHVVVLHPDGIRTSYSFLASIAVHRGDRVAAGQPVGTSRERLHFGARLGDVYIDPAQLFGQGPPEVYLVPDEVRRPASESAERSGLLDMLGGLGSAAFDAGVEGADWVRDRAVDGAGAATGFVGDQAASRFDDLEGAAHYLRENHPATRVIRVAGATGQWWAQRLHCTARDEPVPRLAERHLAILVGGLDSSSAASPIDEVDTAFLGYAPADVMRFSYRGGTTQKQSYAGSDTAIDLRQSGRRLRDLLVSVAAEHPGVPVDILAHSQGGLVARTALAYEVDRGNRRLPPINALVTLASPHQGADLATALTMTDRTTGGHLLESVAHRARPGAADLRGASVHQMAETSTFLRRLNERGLPAGMRVTSIGGRGDLVVPAGHTRLAGASNIVLAPPGFVDQHSRLPGTAAARREIALGLAGRPPTCQGLADMLADAAVSEGISWVEDSAGAAAWAGARSADAVTGAGALPLERTTP